MAEPMNRRSAGSCPIIPGGRHDWLDISTKDDEGRRRFACQGCRMEVVE